MQQNDSEYKALISLLDDDDKEVIDHVESKIISLGAQITPLLKQYIQESNNDTIAHRCEILIQKINLNTVENELKVWFQQKDGNLLHALSLIASVKYPSLDLKNTAIQIERIVQKAWLKTYQSQSPFEQIQIINYILFKELDIEVTSIHQDLDEDLYFIHSILETSRGNTLGVCLLYMIIAQSIDLPVFLVQLPLNSVLLLTKRWHQQDELDQINTTDDILFYINPLYFGTTFPLSEVENYLKKNNIDFTEEIFKPINNQLIVKSYLLYLTHTLSKTNLELSTLYKNLLNAID